MPKGGKFPMAAVEDSSAIAEHGYDADARKMRVTFKNKNGSKGASYEIDGVPPERYAAFTGSKSMGSFYNKKIAPLHVPRRIK